MNNTEAAAELRDIELRLSKFSEAIECPTGIQEADYPYLAKKALRIANSANDIAEQLENKERLRKENSVQLIPITCTRCNKTRTGRQRCPNCGSQEFEPNNL